MSETTTRVTVAALSLKRFTVAELCELTELRRPQAEPVLKGLAKEGLLTQQVVSRGQGPRAANRPVSVVYEIPSDRAKRQELIDRVYRLRRAVGTPEEADSSEDLASIELGLKRLDLLVNLSTTAVEMKPLSHAELEGVERELEVVHGLLERATYRRALDIKREANRDNPVVLKWQHWEACRTRLHAVIDRWGADSSDPVKTELGAVISPRASEVRTLDVVSDPSFVDSALFLWIFHQQPFRQAGLDIECRLVLRDWADVPQAVAEREHSIGFYNRRGDEGRSHKVGYWADLAIYQGYALLAHPVLQLERSPGTIAESEAFLLRLADEVLRVAGHQPRIYSIGNDTIWRFGEYLTPQVRSNRFKHIPLNANDALEKFQNEKWSLFVGGLPQRLHAEAEGAISVLDIRHKPALFSLNGLLFNQAIGRPETAVLQHAVSVWLDTVSRMKADAAYRHNVASSLAIMLEELGTDRSVEFTNGMFDRIFDEELETFPTSPAQLTGSYVDMQLEALTISLTQPPPDKGVLPETRSLLVEAGMPMENSFTPGFRRKVTPLDDGEDGVSWHSTH